MNKRRVVVTGIGMITPYGFGLNNFWDSLLASKSAIRNIQNISLEGQTVTIAGEIDNDYLEKSNLDPKEARRMDRYTHFALIAAEEAMKDAGLNAENIEDPYRYGVIVGSAAGGFDSFERSHHMILEKGPTKCSPFTVPMLICDIGAGRISMKHGLKGLNKAIVTACATSAHCVGDAFRSIQYGDADVVVAGGAEAVITSLGVGAFTAARTLSKSTDPTTASRPYDKDRNGFVMSEGAAILVMEELEHAKARGAKIYGEVAGYGQTADAYDIVAPDPTGSGAAMAMQLAVKDAGIEPEKVGYVNSHGTSTGLGDVAESKAIARVFGDLDTNKDLKVSSTKSMHGHLLGATGAAESIVCLKALQEGIIPPTINLDNQDEEVANLNYVPYKAVKADIEYALTNSFGFGGHNASLLFKKYIG